MRLYALFQRENGITHSSMIRNYVFMPYTLVKDTRTGCETSNVNAVMDGALDPFIESYLNCLATGNWVQKYFCWHGIDSNTMNCLYTVLL